MKAVIQRVTQAQVQIEGNVVGSIGKGFLILLGVGQNDSEEQVEKLWSKIFRMRIFADENGKTNLSLGDVAGEVLVVSQFTCMPIAVAAIVPRSRRRVRLVAPTPCMSAS